ncbi:MAG: NAD(P)/FAD-dependent oxidoreductase [Sulfitobacter sp.]
MRTLIIGGGLSGLALAEALEQQGRDYLLLEARARFGGRIKTENYKGADFDVGPAWFWPDQPRIAALIQRLGLEKFDQFADGILTFEDERGQVQRGRGFASMQGSWRLKGGLGALTQALAARLPQARKRLNAAVVSVQRTRTGITATLSNGDMVPAENAVLAVPPRVASGIVFEPALPQNTVQAMQGISTWMAGQAKAVAVYETAFWRDDGLSGDAQSRFGPMVEIHDASPATGGPYALFGFIGVPPANRTDEQRLRQSLQAQLVRLFGPKAAEPAKLFLKDWAFDPYTATDRDQQPVYAHPTYGLPRDLADLWEGRLQFGGTEVAAQFGGYIEGALEAAENVLLRIKE